MLLLSNINLPLDFDFRDLKSIASKELKTPISNIKTVSLYKKSVDARKKDNVHFCCSFLVSLNSEQQKIINKCKNASPYDAKPYVWKKCVKTPVNPPVIVGFGPAGMFAALTLARAGLCPIVLERGADADTRTKQVENFLNGGKLNTESNVQFGEGGAGTFSDGKLNTGIKNRLSRTVLEEFVAHKAPESILIDAKPHIGTDILVNVVKNIRTEIESLGGKVIFNTKLEKINIKNGKIYSVLTQNSEIPCDKLILATGHSARDTFKMLLENTVAIIKKPFSMGVRIEHLQEDINKSLYGTFYNNKNLGPAEYKLATHLDNGRGVYTFCMCPGGQVINASSENFGIAVNGMSLNARSNTNANSALLVNVEPQDFGGEDILSGCNLQRKIEQSAYNLLEGKVPVNTVGNFLYGEEFKIGKIKPSVKPYYDYGDFGKIFPPFIIESLKSSIPIFDKKIKGFGDKEAILTAPETRSSSPVRIVRNDGLESISVSGLYPCGEGAGYAGGIVSAAVDGITVAEKIIETTY